MNRFFRIRSVIVPTSGTGPIWNYTTETGYKRGLKIHMQNAERRASIYQAQLVSEECINGVWTQFDSWTSRAPTVEEIAHEERLMA